MRSLARYALANAVTRAKISEILTRQDLDGIVRAKSLEEAWGALARTSYGALLPHWDRQDVYDIDRLLHHAAGRRFSGVLRALSGKPKEVAAILLSRWDLDVLEFALRLWHGREPDAWAAYPLFVHLFPIDKLLQAKELGEVVGVLQHTPFAQAVSFVSRDYAQHHSLFYVETALERDYYRRLLDGIRALGGQDARDGQALIGAEIDLLNLGCLARMLEYYEFRPGEFGEFAISGPSPLSRQLTQTGLSTETFSGIYADFLGKSLGMDSQHLAPLERVSFLQNAMSEIMVGQARRSLGGYPFSITGVLAFYILTRVELRSLRAVFSAKVVGLGEDALSTKLPGLR